MASVGIEHRFVADAAGYYYIMMANHSLADVLSQAGERTIGFPLLLYLVRVPLGWFGSVPVERFVNVAAVVLLVLHLGACCFFFFTMRTLVARELGVRLHPVTLLILLSFPGLISYTTVTLTDTFAADLLMAAFGILALADGARPAAARAGLGVAAGLSLGELTLVRPASLVVCGVILAAGAVQAMLVRRSRVVVFASAGAVWAAAVGWQLLVCGRTYGELCLVTPEFMRVALRTSIAWGRISARHYWSSYSPDPTRVVITADPFLAIHLGGRCLAAESPGVLGLCLARVPHLALVLAAKKAVGLFDAYHLTPYVVNLTPRWARLLSRPFGALAFAGFAAACGWLLLGAVRALRRRRLEGGLFPLVLAVPVVHVAWQSLFHVEPRYGLPAVPFVLVALVASVQRAAAASPWKRALTWSALAVAAAVFLWQTHLWDLRDLILQRIEGWSAIS